LANYRYSSNRHNSNRRSVQKKAPKKTTAKKSRISYTYCIAAFVLVYLFAQLLIFFNRDTTNYVVAKQGKIVETFSTQGVIIRDEQLVKSTSSGIVQYYYSGGKELKKNAHVCTLLDDYYGDILEEKIDEIYKQIQEADSGEYKEAFGALDTNISSSIASYLRNKSSNKYADIYLLQDDLRDAVAKRQDMYSLMSNTKVTALLAQQGIYLNEKASVRSDMYLAEAGIIDYSYDGYEGWTVGQIGSNFINNYDSNYSFFEINMQKVEAGTPLYRVITSPLWHIVIFVNEEQAQYFSGENTISFVYNSTHEMNGRIQSLEQVGDDQYKLVLKINTNVQDIMNDRIANIVFTKNSHSGIKISESCIAKKSYYYVPSKYIVNSGDSVGVLAVESGGVTFRPVKLVSTIEGISYIELTEGLAAGTLIQAENSTEMIAIGDMAEVDGVYVVNGGYEQYEIIQVRHRSQGYVIVEGINMYDRVKIIG